MARSKRRCDFWVAINQSAKECRQAVHGERLGFSSGPSTADGRLLPTQSRRRFTAQARPVADLLRTLGNRRHGELFSPAGSCQVRWTMSDSRRVNTRPTLTRSHRGCDVVMLDLPRVVMAHILVTEADL